MPSSPLLIEHHDAVAVLKLNRPERRNALGVEMVALLEREFARLENDPETNVIILAAAPPGFCAGADLKEFGGTDVMTMCGQNARMAALARSFALATKPVIAAVEGFALGGGFVLAASCDIVVTAPGTRWQLPEVALGWLPGCGLQALVSRVGANNARRLALSSEALDGREAHRLGLADYVVPDGESALEAALNRARPIAKFAPHAVASAKRFFAPLVAANAESMDAWASHLFADNANHPYAQASFERFAKR
jgi:enoyl-CoA hydratase/carnithine racemase